MARLTKPEVLYMEIAEGPFRCSKCVMWIPDTDRCSIHPPETEVRAEMVCGLFVPGDPGTERKDPGGYVTAEQSGLGEGETSCGNCRWGVEAQCTHPMLEGWPVDMENGCCNAWTEPASEPGPSGVLPKIVGRR